MRQYRLSACKQAVIWLLTVLLSLTSITFPVDVRAENHIQKAEDYVAASHRRAKAIALSFVRQRSLEAIGQTLTHLAATPDIRALLGQKLEHIDRLDALINLSTDDYASTQFLLAEEINTIAMDFAKNLEQAEQARIHALDLILSARHEALTAQDALKTMEMRLSDLCTHGVAIDIDNPTLPSLQPFVPPLVLQSTTTWNFNGAPVAPPQFSAGSMQSENSDLKVALAAAGATSLVFSALTTTPVLTGEALAAAISKLSAANAAAGFAVVAAIVVTYMLVEHAIHMRDAIKEADDIRQAMTTMVFQRATSEDVRRYSIEACRETLEPVQSARNWIERIRSLGRAPDEFLNLEKSALESFTRLIQAKTEYQEAAKPINDRYSGMPDTKQNQAAWEKEVLSLPQYHALVNATESITPSMAGRIMQIGVTRMVVKSESDLASISKTDRQKLGAIDWRPHRKRLAALRVAAFIAKELKTGYQVRWTNETHWRSEIEEIYRSFDMIIIDLVKVLFAQTSPAPTPLNESLKLRTRHLIAQIKSLQLKWPYAIPFDQLVSLSLTLQNLVEGQK